MWRNNYSAFQKKKFLAKEIFLEAPGIFFRPRAIFFLPPDFFLGA